MSDDDPPLPDLTLDDISKKKIEKLQPAMATFANRVGTVISDLAASYRASGAEASLNQALESIGVNPHMDALIDVSMPIGVVCGKLMHRGADLESFRLVIDALRHVPITDSISITALTSDISLVSRRFTRVMRAFVFEIYAGILEEKGVADVPEGHDMYWQLALDATMVMVHVFVLSASEFITT